MKTFKELREGVPQTMGAAQDQAVKNAIGKIKGAIRNGESASSAYAKWEKGTSLGPVLKNKVKQGVMEAYGPAAPKMKRSMGAGKGTQYTVKYDGGKTTVTAKSLDDAKAKAMSFFKVGAAGKARYMKSAQAMEESVTEASKVPAGTKFIASYVYKGGDGKDHKHTHYRKGNKMSDPVVVHIDGKEWKEFSSFTKAKQAAINHIKGMKKSVTEGVMDDYKAMKAKGKSDAAAIEVMLGMPKYRKMSRDQLAKKIGDEKRKGIFKR